MNAALTTHHSPLTTHQVSEIEIWTKEEWESIGDGPCYWGRRTEHGSTMIIHPIRGCLPLRLDLASFSAHGLDWGSDDAACFQLSVALLADAAGDVLALEFFERLHQGVIARLPADEWVLARADVVNWVRYEILGADAEVLDQPWTFREDVFQARADRTDEDCIDFDPPASDDEIRTAILR